MKLETKYSLGDTVFKISDIAKPKYKECPACEGAKKITLPKTEVECPTCKGHGVLCSGHFTSYFVKESAMTIGQVRFETTSEKTEIGYMCKETGVGSGSVYREDQLFLSKTECQSAANELNETKPHALICPKCNEEIKKPNYSDGEWHRCPIHGEVLHAVLDTKTPPQSFDSE